LRNRPNGERENWLQPEGRAAEENVGKELFKDKPQEIFFDMSLKERITEDMKTALRCGDKAKLNLIRMLRAGIRYKEIETGSELGDDETVEVLSSALKKRKEAVEEFRKGGREDLVSR
jgi:hypothetical protein